MSIYTIADTHLSFGVDKPMDSFPGWDNYVDRLKNNWNKTVSSNDYVIMPGDISWAMNFDELYDDFSFINDLNGKKIIMKGNHDFWWNTLTKLNKFIDDNNFDSIKILHNNSIEIEGVSICGSRFWNYESNSEEDNKILAREILRVKTSLESAKSDQKILFLHYPPVYNTSRCDELIDVLKEFNVKKCYYGHLHGEAAKYSFDGIIDDIKFKLISADKLLFTPYLVLK